MNREADGQRSPGPVILLTAAMGAGHDGAASELADRLNRRGIPTINIHFWELLPLGIGRAIKGFYRWMILRAPWLYRIIYRVFLRPKWRPAGVSPVAVLAEKRLTPWFREIQPSAVVSTFHLCSQVLGDMRRKGTLDAPAISLVVDFAAHATWVNPNVDLHLCLHPSQAARVRALGAPHVEVSGPVVLPHFTHPRWSREEARATLDLPDGGTVVLVVAGSWGAGDVVETARVLGEAGRFHVLVAAGDNEHLLDMLEDLRGGVRGVGWVDDMDRLIVASDVVVENAGGLTAMEAMAMGRPVVSYLPIPGHGVDNVRYMEQAGITVFAGSPGGLINAIDRLSGECPERDEAIARGRSMFRVDAAGWIEAAVRNPPSARGVQPSHRSGSKWVTRLPHRAPTPG